MYGPSQMNLFRAPTISSGGTGAALPNTLRVVLFCCESLELTPINMVSQNLPPPRTAHWAEEGGVRGDRRGMARTLRTPLFYGYGRVQSRMTAFPMRHWSASQTTATAANPKDSGKSKSDRPSTQSRFPFGQGFRPRGSIVAAG